MKFQYLSPVFVAFFTVLIFSACDEDAKSQGEISFSFSTKVSSGGRIKTDEAKSILVTIKNASGNIVNDRKKLSLYKFNEEFLTEPLILEAGSYQLAEFIVLDANDEVLYLTPIRDSELAYLVDIPLPIDFTIAEDQVTRIEPEVIEAEGHTALEFGYATFSFTVTKTIRFVSAAFRYNSDTKSLELTDHKLVVRSGEDILYNRYKPGATNETLLRGGYSDYTVTFIKEGYGTVTKSFTKSALIEDYQVNPLTIVFIDDNLSRGLVAHYTFTDGSTADFSGHHNIGVLHGAVSDVDNLGNEDASLKFDSDDDYVKVSSPSFLDNNEGTFSAWVKFDDLGHIQYVGSVGDEQSNENYISFLRLDDLDHTIGIYQREVGQANWLQGSTVISTGIYYHLTVLSNGSQWRIYINGEEETLRVVRGTNNGKWISGVSSADNFVIGNSIIQAPYEIPYLSGNIDEVRLYDRALMQEEIEELYRTTH